MTIITVSADVAAQAAESLLQTNADRLVQREVQLCLSSMVAMLSRGDTYISGKPSYPALSELCAQALELCSPGLDYEEAARQAGWKPATEHPDHYDADADASVWVRPCVAADGEHCETGLYEALSAQDACEDSNIEPYEWEVFEHWAVSTWLAEKLQEAGERVDTDFAGLNVWARTTTGQAISMDGVIRAITTALHADAV